MVIENNQRYMIQINRVKDFIQFINEGKNEKGIKLGDKIERGKIDTNGFTKSKIRSYRVIGLNPNLKLQEVLNIKGEVELGKIEEFDWDVTKSFRPMFPDNHFIHSIDDGDWSHIWIGDF